MNAQHTPTPWAIGPEKKLVGNIQFLFVNANTSVGSAEGFYGDAAFIVRACNSHDALVAALKEAARLAWEVGCETEDGVMTLLEDSRGDLYRLITAALAAAGEGA